MDYPEIFPGLSGENDAGDGADEATDSGTRWRAEVLLSLLTELSAARDRPQMPGIPEMDNPMIYVEDRGRSAPRVSERSRSSGGFFDGGEEGEEDEEGGYVAAAIGASGSPGNPKVSPKEAEGIAEEEAKEIVGAAIAQLNELDVSAEQGKAASEPPPERMYNLNISTNVSRRDGKRRAPSDLGRATGGVAVPTLPVRKNHTGLKSLLNDKSAYLYPDYINNLDISIQKTLVALAETPEDDPSYIEALTTLSHLLTGRYQRFGELSDLQNAIEQSEIVLAVTPRDSACYAAALNTVSVNYHLRYHRLANIDDIGVAIQHTEEALTVTPIDDANYAGLQSSLGSYLYIRYKHTNNLDDLERAREQAEIAVNVTPDGDPERGGRLLNLSNTYSGRYRRLGNVGDLKRAIECAEASLEAALKGDNTDCPGVMSNLGGLLVMRFKELGDVSDLEAGIRHAEAAVEATPEDNPYYAERMLNLANWIQARYMRLGEMEDLERAIQLSEASLAIIPENHRIRGGAMVELSDRLRMRYMRQLGGSLEDLEAAIIRGEEALAAAPGDHPDRKHIMGNLGETYGARYHRLGNVGDIEKAIENTQEALAALPEGHPVRAAMLSHLSDHLYSRYERINALNDLTMSIEQAEAAVYETPVGRPERPSKLCTLCKRLMARYKRTWNSDDLFTAITLSGVCLKDTPQDDRYNLSERLAIRAEALHARYLLMGLMISDVDRAITMTAEAISLISPGSFRRADLLHKLGVYFRTRYRKLRSIGDIDRAVQYIESALDAIPEDQPNRAEMYDSLAKCLMIRYQAKGRIGEDGDLSLRCFIRAWECLSSPPLVRIMAGAKAAESLISSKKWGEASSLLEGCIELMPKISLPFLKRSDQQNLMARLAGIASLSAATALEAGKGASHALRLLELSRGIITGFIIDCRSDLSDLSATNPDLFESFTRLQREIDSKLPEPPQTSDRLADLGMSAILRQRRRAFEEMEAALSKIRQLPGHKNFLLPPTPEDLMKMAGDGPIVVLNPAISRCDAIIVTTSAIESIKLTDFDPEEAAGYMVELTGKIVIGPMKTYAARNNKLKKVLLWLWDVIVGPVLEKLELSETNGDLTQIWWIGTGMLSMAPFHAAGDHSPGSTRNTISRAISSYIPTIKALSYARQKKLNLSSNPDSPSHLLLVTMPTTPEHGPLPGVEKEANSIIEIVGGQNGAIQTTVLHQPSATKVLEEFRRYNAVHFACHGITDAKDPSNSSLLLLNEDTTSLDRLTVQDISDTNTENAQVVYLSACCTAENSARALADETIHLAHAFQLAGFSHVLATLWESKDSACVEVAGGFYGSLLHGRGGGGESHRRIGVAMHQAVGRLRDQNPGKVLAWAPFIHTGA